MRAAVAEGTAIMSAAAAAAAGTCLRAPLAIRYAACCNCLLIFVRLY